MPKGMQAIYTQTVGAGGTTGLSFNNIPQDYTDLKIIVCARSAFASTTNDLLVYVNNNQTISSYSQTGLSAAGTSSGSAKQTGLAGFWSQYVPAANSTANTFGNTEIYIPNYSTSQFKQIVVDSTSENNSSTGNFLVFNAHLYRSHTPITQLSLTLGGQTIVQHSTFTLYGISR
jgi:hypothetical protein